MLIIENPSYFVIGEKWKEDDISRAREIHPQKLQSFLWKTNIEQAINLELMDAIPKPLLNDHTDDEGTITASIKLILSHMEETYVKIRPKDISSIMQTITADFDSTTTMSTYFDRQQGCQKLLRATKEPIIVAAMVRTSLGHSNAYHT